jgi:hypothetical protein
MKYIRGLSPSDSLVIAMPGTRREEGKARNPSGQQKNSSRDLTAQQGLRKWLAFRMR